MIEALAAAVTLMANPAGACGSTSCSTLYIGDASALVLAKPDAPALVLTKPPCGTPEAAKAGDCQLWVVRKPPTQPADQWPPYERPSPNLVDPFAMQSTPGTLWETGPMTFPVEAAP